MSWYVEGRRYTNYAEYQRALAEAEQRKAARAADELSRENRRLMDTIAQDRAAMEQVRNDVRRQMDISRRIESNVQALHRNQRRLEEVTQQTERRMQEGFAQLEREIQQQGSKLHGVQVDVDKLRENHLKHVEETRRNLATVRQEMADGLAKAEAQRKQSEERLKASIKQVGQKIEEDRAERARHAKDQLALARAEGEAASSALSRIEAEVQMLALDGDVQQVKAQLASAQTLISQQNASAALAVSSLARASAESLEHEARVRKAELDSARQDFKHRATWITDAIGTNASEDCKDCYEIEIKEIEATVSAARNRLQSRYRNYRLLQIEQAEDEKLLERLERQALDMTASASIVAEAAQQRMAHAEEALRMLEKVYGEATRVDRRFARPGDPKSDLLLGTVFGSTKVDMRFNIDGVLTIDGYGHSSQGECATAAHSVLQELQAQSMIRTIKTDDYARSAPQKEAAAPTPAENAVKVS